MSHANEYWQETVELSTTISKKEFDGHKFYDSQTGKSGQKIAQIIMATEPYKCCNENGSVSETTGTFEIESSQNGPGMFKVDVRIRVCVRKDQIRRHRQQGRNLRRRRSQHRHLPYLIIIERKM